MRIRVVQSKDSDVDFFDRVRERVEGKFAPLELERKDAMFFYELPRLVDDHADLNIVFLFPRREYASIAAVVLAKLLEKKNVRVVFEWYENVPASEEQILAYLDSLLP